MNLEQVMTDAFGEPTPKQAEFYTAKTRYVGYGGARGGGKSHGVRAKATALAYEYPGIRMLIVRRTFPELRENHTLNLIATYSKFPEEIRPVYTDGDKAFSFPSTSRIKLAFCATDADVGQFQGQEYDVIFVDESTQITEYQFGWINACVRGANNFPKRTYLTCNPGGVGHAWVKRLFIDKEYKKGERPSEYSFINAKVWDNLPLLMSDPDFARAYKLAKRKGKVTEAVIKDIMHTAGYVRQLDSLPAELREAWLEGNWDVFAGQYFSEFDERIHVVKPFDIPEYWRKSAAIDYGLDRFAVLWFATDEEGYSYCYRNMEWTNLIASSAAQVFKENTPERIEEIIAPPDLWNRRNDTGKSVVEIFAENGIYLIKAGNERIAGWRNVKEYLKVINDKSKMSFFNTCKPIIKCLPLLQHDENKIEDVAKDPHDITHSPDALRYWCSRWQINTTVPPKAQVFNFKIEKPKDEGFGEVTEDYLCGGY